MRTPAIVIVLLSLAQAAVGQIETTQYFMTSLPQVIESNPAFMPKYGFALGLPFSRISAYYANSGFNYNDATRRENNKRILDLDQLQSALPEKTYITNASQVDVFRLGLRFGSNFYLSLHSSVRGYTQSMMPKDVVALVAGGTAAYVGKTANLSPAFHGMTFWETGVGIGFAPFEKLRVGARLKKLYGAHGVQTELSDISLSVADNYAINVTADAHIRTSGVQDPELIFSNYLNNSGWSGDIGVTYKLLPKFTLAASIVDAGFLKWTNNVYDYTLDKETANFNFSGLDVQDLLDGNTDSFDQQLDSLAENFTPVDAPGSAFSMMLPAKLYLSGSFDVTKSFTIGGVFFAEQFMGRTATGWTTALNKNFGRVLSTSLSYTLSNRSHNNLGAGISLNMAPFQVYIVGDNLLRAPVSLVKTGYVNEFVNSTQVFNVRLGVNFVWGWKKDVAPSQEEDNSKSYNSGKKEKTKPINEDNSKSYNGKKSGAKTTSNTRKQPQARKKKQPAHIRARQKR